MKEEFQVITEKKAETAILVGIITQDQDERKTTEYLDELEFLADTAGVRVMRRFTQKIPQALAATYVGKGKLEEMRDYIKRMEDMENEVGMAIFDDELTAKQMSAIESVLGVKVLDRTSLILDIFAMRAQTAHAKTQVELAQYRYLLPRLQRMWTHLERQGGGSGAGGGKGTVGLRGPGETQLEMDRRIITKRISWLKEQLADIDRQKSTMRKNRGRLIRVALVGYTNVGKSTLMNLLRKLPTDLVESFKSTLDEVREADLLIHVVDISHPDFEDQMKVVDKTLADLGAGEKPTIVLFNKTDAYTWVEKEADDLTPATRENITMDELQRTWMGRLNGECLFVSALKKTGIENMRKVLYDRVKQLHVQKYPYNDFLYPDME